MSVQDAEQIFAERTNADAGNSFESVEERVCSG